MPTGCTVSDGVGFADGARNALTFLVDEDITGLDIPLSKTAAEKLREFLRLVGLMPDLDTLDEIESDHVLSDTLIADIGGQLDKFNVVLEAELASLGTYFVEQKGIYRTTDLLERAEEALGDSAEVIAENARKDFNQAGRCLALDLPTASAFHATRAIEAVLRQYHSLVMRRPADTTPANMAVCIRELRAAGEDPKLLEILDHIRDLHRNTTMHPGVFLDTNEALRLFDVVKSAMNAMADRIRSLRRPARSVLPFDSGRPGSLQ